MVTCPNSVWREKHYDDEAWQILSKILLEHTQLCSHFPSTLNAGATRSDVPYGNAPMFLIGEENEATEPYNKDSNLFISNRTFNSQTFLQNFCSVLVSSNLF